MQTTWITQVAFKPCNPRKRQRDQSQRILLTYDINKPIKFYFSFIEQKLNQIKKFDQSVFNCPALKLLVTKTAPTYFYNRKVGFIFRGSIRVSLCKNFFLQNHRQILRLSAACCWWSWTIKHVLNSLFFVDLVSLPGEYKLLCVARGLSHFYLFESFREVQPTFVVPLPFRDQVFSELEGNENNYTIISGNFLKLTGTQAPKNRYTQ